MRDRTDKGGGRTARRNMVAGLLAGAIMATVAGAYAKTTYKKMVNGAPATAADVNKAHQDLADAIDKLELKIIKLESDPDCPPGYTKDSTAASITLCRSSGGSDEMVKVGSYWLDRYEAILVDSKTYNGGKCDGAGKQYGAGSNDDYPSTFQDSGDRTTKVYACSKKGSIPSRNMTWFQAQQACLLANKQLCTNGQWQGAAAGTYDKGKYNGATGGSCHTGGTGPRKTGMAGQVPGASASCISSWGAEDMIGNLWEWVDMWGQAGMTWLTTNGQLTAPWPSGKGYGDGGDSTWNINGRAAAATTAFVNGSPAAAIRSGSWAYGVDAGTFALGMDSSPARWSAGIGARCCIE